MNSPSLTGAPFLLTAKAAKWVHDTLQTLSFEKKLAQLILPQRMDPARENLDRLIQLGVGGVFRRGTFPAERLRLEAEYLQQHSEVPLLLPGDLEFLEGELVSSDGLSFPNQMAVAATRDPRWATRMGTMAAREGRDSGFNWTFSPVGDINFNHESCVVNTRSFGDDVERVRVFVQHYLKAVQAGGMAACVKHWPGDGMDDRDQHFVTSVNSANHAYWNSTYGKVFRGAIKAGVLSVMAGHIAFPAVDRSGLPASLSPLLSHHLLRKKFGFNGVIISDGMGMGGIGAHGTRAQLVSQVINSGCDMVLFSPDPELDLHFLERATRDRRLSLARIDEAVIRILALKAALRLPSQIRHKKNKPLALRYRREHRGWSQACAEHAVTLVQDTAKLLPLDPRRHRRVLLAQQVTRANFFGPLPPLQMDRLLQKAGFSVELFDPESTVTRDQCDLLIYVVGEEGRAFKNTLKLNWRELHGDHYRGIERYWHDVPTIFISLGTPYTYREVPQCPTYINAYSPVLPMQEAVIKALLGKIPFRGKSPVQLHA